MTTRDQWLTLRRNSLGASDAAIILGASNYGSPVSLWSEKTGLAESVVEETADMEWSRVAELSLAKWYEMKTGRPIENPGEYEIATHPKYPWMSATLDRVVYSEEDDALIPLELKNMSLFNQSEWDDLAGHAPIKYLIQLQHQMAVTNAPAGAFCCCIGGKAPIHFDVPRDDEFIDETLIPVLEEFWGYVQDEEMPPVDGSEPTRKALKRLYPEETNESIVLPFEAFEKDERRMELKGLEKELKKELDEIDNWLLSVLKENSVGIGPGFNYTLKKQERKESVIPACSFKVLRRQQIKK